MEYLDWDEAKNNLLKKDRGVSFEDVQTAMESGKILDVFSHPNQNRYPGQKIMIVKIDNYAYIIPYVADEKKIFLKTIIPSRKATKKYLKEK